MPDAPPPRDDGAPASHRPEVLIDRPAEAPRYGWFAGVLEGRPGDAAALREAAERIAAPGGVGCDLEIVGGRFSFLFDEEPVRGSALTIEDQDALVEGLQGLVAAARPDTVESTLRSSLVYSSSVVETLFAVRDGRVEPVSRLRELEERDRARTPDGTAAPGGIETSLGDLGRRRGILLLVLVIVAGGLLAWNRGYADVLRGAIFAPDELGTSTGPFGDALEITADRRFARHEIEVRRGPLYPATADAVEALIAAADTAEERAAASAIGNGGEIGVTLVAGDGSPLEVEPIRLAALLGDADAVVEAVLPTKLRGRRIVLSVDPRAAAGKRNGRGD